MDRLKGKTIFIGKEPGQGRLMLAIKDGGQIKATTLGQTNSVPNCVSRCKPAEDIAHCKIDFDSNGQMTITNLKSQNITYINGIEIVSKRISTSDLIALGKDKFILNISSIIDCGKKLLGPIVEEFSIKHLEYIWEKYEKVLENITIQQQEKGRKRMLPLMVSIGSGALTAILTPMFGPNALITAIIPIISFVMYLKIYNEKDTSVEDRKKVQNELIDNYICPNPKCKHFLGQQPYKVLRQNKNCPYCKAKWNEK